MEDRKGFGGRAGAGAPPLVANPFRTVAPWRAMEDRKGFGGRAGAGAPPLVANPFRTVAPWRAMENRKGFGGRAGRIVALPALASCTSPVCSRRRAIRYHVQDLTCILSVYASLFQRRLSLLVVVRRTRERTSSSFEEQADAWRPALLRASNKVLGFLEADLARSSTILWIASCLAAAALPCLAQETTFSDELHVDLVPIVVTVQQWPLGQGVMDLGVGDFEVFEDGEPVPVTHFERVVAGSIEPAGEEGLFDSRLGTTSGEGSLPRYFVLGFDFGSLEPARLYQVASRSKEFVEGVADPNTYWSVVVLGPGARVLLPFSNNRWKVSGALDSLYGLRLGTPVTAWGGGSILGGTGTSGAATHPTARERGSATLDNLTAVARDRDNRIRAQRLFESLEAVFSGWSSLEGSKTLLLNYQQGSSEASGSGGARDNSREIHELVESVAQKAATAGFVIYSSDAAGLRNPSLHPGLAVSTHRTVANSLAVETGGWHVALNDLARSIELAVNATENHYRIWYQVARAPDGREHSIAVRVKRKGRFRVRHPKRILHVTPRDRLIEQLRTTANIPKVATQLPVSLVVEASWSERNSLALESTLSVPTERLGLISDDGERTGRVEFFFAVYNASGVLLDLASEERVLAVGSDSAGEAQVQSFLTTLPPDDYTIAMAVLDLVDGNVGMDFARVDPLFMRPDQLSGEAETRGGGSESSPCCERANRSSSY